jgi:transcriptional regulator with PAS, ATPase and Fis domain
VSKANEIVKELDSTCLKFSIHSGRLAVTKEEFRPFKEARDEFVRDYVARALEVSRGSVTAAARLLNVSHQNLGQMIERHGLRELRTPKKKRLKSIIKIKKGGVRCFKQNPS